MTKAERRKRARARARERQQATEASEAGTVTAAPDSATALEVPELPPLDLVEDRTPEQLAADGDLPEDEIEAEPIDEEACAEELDDDVVFGGEPLSEYITGHVEPKPEPRPEPRRATRLEMPREHEPVDTIDDEGEGEDAPFDEDSDEDDSEVNEEDALFNLACASIEQGDAFEWQELVLWLVTVEVDDPRLALLATLLAQEGKSASISGEKVLAALGRIGLGELVTEAREAVAEGPEEDEDEEDEPERAPDRDVEPIAARPIVRTSAAAIRAATRGPKPPPPPPTPRRPGLIGTPSRANPSRRVER